MLKIIIIALVVTVVGICVFSAVDSATNQGVGTTTSYISGATDDLITVTLTGEIDVPGTYYVEEGVTLGAALEAAGGATSNADPRAYDTTFKVEDGMKFYIAPIYDNGDTCAVSPIEKVNINEAGTDELLEVPGFGTAIASALVDYRQTTATFKRIEDIKNVAGIGDATFTKAKNYIILTN